MVFGDAIERGLFDLDIPDLDAGPTVRRGSALYSRRRRGKWGTAMTPPNDELLDPAG